MKNRLIEDKTVKQIVIDAELHRQLKIYSAKVKRSIKELVEEAVAECYDIMRLSENDN